MSRGPKADWVYRPNIYDDAGSPFDTFGTYSPWPTVLTSGQNNAEGLILYDSHNYLNKVVSFGNIPIPFANAARAEGSRAKVIAVEGHMTVVPSAWAVGTVFQLGMRFGIFEQDAVGGFVLVDTNYNMFFQTALTQLHPAVHANTRLWQREFRRREDFIENRGSFTYRFRFRVNRFLNPNQCYAIYLESSTTNPSSVNLSLTPWFRTLVADEG